MERKRESRLSGCFNRVGNLGSPVARKGGF